MALPQFKISKPLSYSDITTKFVFPTEILEHILLPQGTHSVDLLVMDSTEELRELRYYTRPSGNRACPVFTKGWQKFVRDKKLQVDDELIFYGYPVRSADGELKMQCMVQVTRKSVVTFQGEPVYLEVENFL